MMMTTMMLRDKKRCPHPPPTPLSILRSKSPSPSSHLSLQWQCIRLAYRDFL